MEPVTVVAKRKSKDRDVDYSCCLFCQKQKSDELRTATLDGKKRTQDAAEQRRKLGDTTYHDMFEALDQLSPQDFNGMEIKWHKSCYSVFTSKTNISRLRAKRQGSGTNSADQQCIDVIPQPIRRSSQGAVDWKLCMFCQKCLKGRSQKGRLHMVQTLEKSAELIEYSKNDPVMSTRLAGVCDLVAAEACYHLPCMIRFERQCKQKQPSFAEEGQRDFCLNQLCVYLIRGLGRGHVYDMVDVWSTYEKMCSDMDVEPTHRYQSRRTTFYEDIQRLIGPQACFV